MDCCGHSSRSSCQRISIRCSRWGRWEEKVFKRFVATSSIIFIFSCSPLLGFQRKDFRGKLAIGLTVNFINRNTTAEAKVEEISGVAFIFNQEFFKVRMFSS